MGERFDIVREAALGQATLRVTADDLLQLAKGLDPWVPAIADILRGQVEELREAASDLRRQTEEKLSRR